METAKAHMENPGVAARTKVQILEIFKEITFGSAAGIAGKFIEYPFDTVKVRLQSQHEGHSYRYKGPVDCFHQSFKAGGISGLYRGISAPLVGAALENSSLFFSYHVAQDLLQKTVYPASQELPFSALLVCGAASGAFTSFILTPIELVKCKMQVPETTKQIGYFPQPGPFALIREIFRQKGLFGFWRGHLGTFIRETGGSAAWFGSYEGVTRFFRERSLNFNPEQPRELPVYQQMLAGAAAGVSYNFMFYPADTIKSRMQTEESSHGDSHRSFASIGRSLYRQQGIRGFYQGCGITLARAGPSSAFIFTVYEVLKSTFE